MQIIGLILVVIITFLIINNFVEKKWGKSGKRKWNRFR